MVGEHIFEQKKMKTVSWLDPTQFNVTAWKSRRNENGSSSNLHDFFVGGGIFDTGSHSVAQASLKLTL